MIFGSFAELTSGNGIKVPQPLGIRRDIESEIIDRAFFLAGRFFLGLALHRTGKEFIHVTVS